MSHFGVYVFHDENTTVDELLASDGVERFFWTFDGASPLTSGTGPSKVNGIQSVSERT